MTPLCGTFRHNNACAWARSNEEKNSRGSKQKSIGMIVKISALPRPASSIMANSTLDRRYVVGILGDDLVSHLYLSNIDINLALQGAFIEHKMTLESLPYQSSLEIILVKAVDDLNRCDALIIPGGGG